MSAFNITYSIKYKQDLQDLQIKLFLLWQIRILAFYSICNFVFLLQSSLYMQYL